LGWGARETAPLLFLSRPGGFATSVARYLARDVKRRQRRQWLASGL